MPDSQKQNACLGCCRCCAFIRCSSQAHSSKLLLETSRTSIVSFVALFAYSGFGIDGTFISIKGKVKVKGAMPHPERRRDAHLPVCSH